MSSPLKLSLYWQGSSPPREKDGLVFYAGEDARPWADAQLLLVADGMGGDGAIYHRSLDYTLFDREQIVGFLFGENSGTVGNGRFSAYVQDSFEELYPLRSLYENGDLDALKKSAYFGSRLAASVMIREFLINPDFSPPYLFSALDAAPTPEAKAQTLQVLESAFSLTLDKELRRISSKANLVYESPFTGMKLLGTTLCAILLQETGSAVQALVVMTGDSIPYIWTSKHGLMPISGAQRSTGGGGTKGCISISKGSTIKLHCRYLRFDTPCVFLCATDGCWDSPGFKLSPLGFERCLLGALSNADSPDGAVSNLQQFYSVKENCRGDDSGSLAAAAFGFEDYSALKTAAAERRAYLQQAYFNLMPELLQRDYRKDLKLLLSSQNESLSALKSRIIKEPAFLQHCVRKIKESGELPELPLPELDEQIARAERVLSEAKQELSSAEALQTAAPHTETFFSKEDVPALNPGTAEDDLSEHSLPTVPIDKLKQKVDAASEEVLRLKEEKRLQGFVSAVRNYPMDHFLELLESLSENRESGLPEVLAAEVRKARKALSCARDEAERNAELQDTLLARYHTEYESMMEGKT